MVLLILESADGICYQVGFASKVSVEDYKRGNEKPTSSGYPRKP